jgi:hypothetical protein
MRTVASKTAVPMAATATGASFVLKMIPANTVSDAQ